MSACNSGQGRLRLIAAAPSAAWHPPWPPPVRHVHYCCTPAPAQPLLRPLLMARSISRVQAHPCVVTVSQPVPPRSARPFTRPSRQYAVRAVPSGTVRRPKYARTAEVKCIVSMLTGPGNAVTAAEQKVTPFRISAIPELSKFNVMKRSLSESSLPTAVARWRPGDTNCQSV
jgi:hypothetical protein